MAKVNPYNYLQRTGVPGGKTTILPNNYKFELTMDTWWSAVTRARDFSDFTGLDALYSYCMKSSTLIRSAIDKRLRPLKARTFAVYIDGKEDERLTEFMKNNPKIRFLIYQKGLSNFTFARVVGFDKNKRLKPFIYPLRQLDVVNEAVKNQTYDTEGRWIVDKHVNMFWMQTEYDSEDTLGLLEPISRDYINMVLAQNDWQTASRFLAYPQTLLYYESGDEKMLGKAVEIAQNLGVGNVPVAAKSTDQESGKVLKEFELESPYNGNAADTFRIFKENKEMLGAGIMQLVIGSSLLGMSDKNTNSERLIRAHLKMFRDICESDAIEVQDWFNDEINKAKLAYLFNEPDLARATFKVKPSDYIDVGDLETFVKMMKDLGMYPTYEFVKKSGLSEEDVILTENGEDITDTGEGDEVTRTAPKNASTKGRWPRMAVEFAKRVLNAARPSNRKSVEEPSRDSVRKEIP